MSYPAAHSFASFHASGLASIRASGLASVRASGLASVRASGLASIRASGLRSIAALLSSVSLPVAPAVAFLLLCALVIPAGAQQGRWQNERGPYGGTFTCIIAHDDSLVAAPYYRPFLLIGGADGEQWREIEMPSPVAEAFSLLSPGGGRLLAGSFGRIYRTDDNGAHWQEISLPDLQGAIVTGLAGNGDTLYACGGGMLLRSTNRGIRWNVLPDAPATDAVIALPGLLIAGGPAGITRSTDGGSSWMQHPTVPDSVAALFNVDGMLFAALHRSERDTIAPALFRSTDAGESWMAADLASAHIVAMAARDGMLFTGDDRPSTGTHYYQSSDSGRSWNVRRESMPPFPRTITVLAPAADGLLAGLGGIGIWKLEDNAESWRTVSYGHFPVGVAKLTFDDERIYAYSMKENFIALRGHGTQRWERLPYSTYDGNRPGERPGDMLLHDGTMFLGRTGAVMRSASMGADWITTPLPAAGQRVQALHAAGDRIIAGIAEKGAIYSDDGGDTWRGTLESGPDWWFDFAGEGSDVYAATSDGVLQSTDRGGTWHTLENGGAYAVALLDASTLLTASESGVRRYRFDTRQWRTLRGGAAYVLHVLPSGKGFFAATGDSGAVYFADAESALPLPVNDGLPQVGFAPPTVCRIAFASHNGRLYFGNCGLPGLWSLDLSAVVSAEQASALPEYPSITHVYPHPLRSRGTVRLVLPAAAPVRLRLTDALGRTRLLLHEGMMPAGSRTLPFPAASLEAGIYHLILQSPTATDIRTVIMM